jgi:FkbM family methyltransferase
MLKAPIKHLAKKLGYEVLGHSRAYLRERSLAALLKKEQINLILDIGANTGQFASEIREAEYDGRIISFEPLSSAHAELKNRASKDPRWIIADRTAIGARKDSIEIHVSANSVSSSILNMLSTHSDAAPESGYMGTETVAVNPLDSLFKAGPDDRVAMKIDVQGYERQVLEGARGVLASSLVVISEMSLVPLYEGQILANEFWELMIADGFEAWSLEPGFRHPETKRMLQVDGIFVRRKQ